MRHPGRTRLSRRANNDWLRVHCSVCTAHGLYLWPCGLDRLDAGSGEPNMILRNAYVVGLCSVWLLAATACDQPEPLPQWPPPHVHHKRTTGVFFDSGSAVPTAGSLRNLDKELSGGDYVAKNVLAPGATRKICVVGGADTVGSESENMKLSQRRAEWVANYLIKAGVPKERLVVSSRRSSGPLVRTPPNTPEPQNRNVLIEWLDCPQG